MREFSYDTFFMQGTTHTVCQDYALAGDVDGYPFIIVADGCSGSEDSDTGARILARCAASLISLLDNPVPEAAAKTFATVTIRQARNFLLPGLQRSALDATLLAAVALEDRFRVVMYGDGTIFTPDAAKNINVEFTKSAPFYLNYLDDPDRLSAYRVAGPQVCINQGELQNPETTTLVFDFPYSDFPAIGIGSDGWSTFTDESGNTTALKDIEKELMAFKNINGNFVQRRIRNGLIRTLGKEGFSAADDTSFAAMVIKE